MPNITQSLAPPVTEQHSKTKALTRLEHTLATGGREQILLAIDHSGSMDVPFMGHTKRRIDGAIDAVDRIVRSSHRGMSAIGLAPFSDGISLLEPIGSNFTGIISKAAGLQPEGGTLYVPIFQLVLNTLQPPPHRVILLSDGEPYDGKDALNYAETCGMVGIRFDCVGIGESDPELLKEIARRTQGIYAYCDDLASLTKTFAALETRTRFQLEHKPNTIRL